MDLLFINPGGRKEGYQKFGDTLAAVEPPIWIAILAGALRRAGLDVAIVDADAENLSPSEVAARVEQAQPVLAASIVFGANPSASTQKMTSAGAICRAIRNACPEIPQILGGLHVSALPQRTLQEEAVDFVVQGEGPRTLLPLVKLLKARGASASAEDLATIPGLWYRTGDVVAHNAPAPLIEDLEADLGCAAWDLLPMERYRAHNWHCFDDLDHRSPYAVIYTSLGCPFRCHFCCINALFGKSGIRYRPIDEVVSEIDLLVNRYGVRHIKILDELFVLKRDRIERFCDMLIERRYNLNFWAYARVDTVDEALLHKLRRAGVNWLAYGFESASARVRDGVAKGYTPQDLQNAIRWTQQAGIAIIANYIVGLPDDDQASMQATLDEAIAHNFEYLNLYCAMAYPGSRLYEQAVREGWPLPDSWHGYSQLGEETLPLPTKHLTAEQVLAFRDKAFVAYHSRPEYLQMIARKFGVPAVEHIKGMLSHTISRKITDRYKTCLPTA
jgi:radical SAM superfamily enzyme YgiQ (UPF0313 family)